MSAQSKIPEFSLPSQSGTISQQTDHGVADTPASLARSSIASDPRSIQPIEVFSNAGGNVIPNPSYTSMSPASIQRGGNCMLKRGGRRYSKKRGHKSHKKNIRKSHKKRGHKSHKKHHKKHHN
jgi:hypothetical protein